MPRFVVLPYYGGSVFAATANRARLPFELTLEATALPLPAELHQEAAVHGSAWTSPVMASAETAFAGLVTHSPG